MGVKEKKDATEPKEKEATPPAPVVNCDNEQARLSKEPCPDQHTSESCSIARPEPRVPGKKEKVYDACPQKEKVNTCPADPCVETDDAKYKCNKD